MSKPSTSLEQRDIRSVLHPATDLELHREQGPMVIKRGKGVRVWDDRGKEYIEAMAGLWCTALGYGVEELAETAYRQMKTLAFGQLFVGKSNEPAIVLSEKLLEMMPMECSKVFLGNSGSDANDTQLKLLWYYNNAIGRPRKKKVISRLRAYHGVTVAAASLTGIPVFHADFDLPIPNILHTDCPHYYSGAEPGESEEEFASRLAANLERLILDEDPDTVAAFIAEPVIGGGGLLVPPRGYFEKVQAVLAKYDVLLIDDEVICGFGRTGELWGAESFNMKPHTMSVAKALSSAYLPISAVMVPEFMYEPMAQSSHRHGTFGHGYTYSGHPVAAAVAVRNLELMEEWKVLEHVRAVSPHFQKCLNALAGHPLVGEVRGVGLMGACELVKDKRSKQSFDASQRVAQRLQLRCESNGLIVRALGEAVAMAPPLIIKEDEISEIFARLGKSLDEILEELHKEGLLTG